MWRWRRRKRRRISRKKGAGNERLQGAENSTFGGTRVVVERVVMTHLVSRRERGGGIIIIISHKESRTWKPDIRHAEREGTISRSAGVSKVFARSLIWSYLSSRSRSSMCVRACCWLSGRKEGRKEEMEGDDAKKESEKATRDVNGGNEMVENFEQAHK